MKYLVFLFCISFAFTSIAKIEEEVQLETEGCTLKGTLSTQDDPSISTPLIILIAGSGPTDRDGNNPQMKNNSLKMVSDFLVENGYACLRYDKRAIAESTIEDLNMADLSFDDLVSDAEGWVNQYAGDVRFHSIILAGHSQGSLVGLLAANENVNALISLAGAGEPIHNILKFQLAGQYKPEIESQFFAKLDSMSNGHLVYNDPELNNPFLDSELQPFLISWMKYDPATEISKLKIPILIVNGTTDVQVTVDQAKLLSEANENASLSIIKNMNHILKFTKETQVLNQMEIYYDSELPIHKKLKKSLLQFLSNLN